MGKIKRLWEDEVEDVYQALEAGSFSADEAIQQLVSLGYSKEQAEESVDAVIEMHNFNSGEDDFLFDGEIWGFIAGIISALMLIVIILLIAVTMDAGGINVVK